MLHNANIIGFAQGTPVLMANGQWKLIEQIKEGDSVLSFDPDSAELDFSPKKVIASTSATMNDCIEVWNGDRVTVVAREQLFFTPERSWSAGYETKSVIDYSRAITEIQTRKVKGGKWKIFDIEVEDNHSLIANGLMAHNGSNLTRKKKVVQVAQPIVTAGKPGKPVSVTVTDKTGTKTVTVNPLPGSSAQVTSSSNSTSVRYTSIAGLPVDNGAVITQPSVVLPYPSVYALSDKAATAEALRADVCGGLLDEDGGETSFLSNSKKKKINISKKKKKNYAGTLQSLERTFQDMKSVRYSPVPGTTGSVQLWQDTTLIDDAIAQAREMRKKLTPKKPMKYKFFEKHCDRLQSLISQIGNQTSYPILPPVIIAQPPVVISPPAESYSTDRVYETDVNYQYFITAPAGNRYYFDPPNAPASPQLSWYRHYDIVRGQLYYDRVSAGSINVNYTSNSVVV